MHMINTIIWQFTDILVYWFFKLWLLEQLIFLKYHPVILHHVNIWIYWDTFLYYPLLIQTSLVAQTVKRLPAMQETWVQSLGQEDHLEKEMATHSSTLAWKIPWMEEPGRLQCMGSQRVRHNWMTSLSLHFY